MTTLYSDLKNKKILVTGANRGIGRSIALELARQGVHIACGMRPEREGFEELCAQIEQLGGKASRLNLVMTDQSQMKSATEEFIGLYGPFQGLVNNAGLSKDTLILRLKQSELSEIIDINLNGAILLTSVLSRYFLKTPHASIVNISSIVGLMGNPAQSAYAASKAGLLGFTKSLAKELASRNVRCNAICPGFIETDMTDALDAKIKETYLSTIPLKRMGHADEVARLTCFLLSEDSSYITGEIIKIDGGLYI